ncbi:hypothetical protein FOCG_14030 [Fusarium oxysporum f. sp. radicis-lycopersici 26381]|nr:hypothetical protein FOCG_14030 [Fusarium oxysporum f. sp. radicis-lycopersici 26381]RKK60432.1 hypothetical protein BFJ66_g1844 [Fusarium oxysporum f. sp. cepae]
MKSTKKRRKAFEDNIGKGVAGVDAGAGADAVAGAAAAEFVSYRVQSGPAQGEDVDLPTTAPERRRWSQIIDSSARGLL